MPILVENKPLRILTGENSLEDMAKWELNLPTDNMCFSCYYAQFSQYSSHSLKMYRAVLVSDYEIWETMDGSVNQIKTALITAGGTIVLSFLLQADLAGVATNSLTYKVLGGFVGGLVAALFVVGLVYLRFPVRKMAIKKAKAVFLTNIIKHILEERREYREPRDLESAATTHEASYVDQMCQRIVNRVRKGTQSDHRKGARRKNKTYQPPLH